LGTVSFSVIALARGTCWVRQPIVSTMMSFASGEWLLSSNFSVTFKSPSAARKAELALLPKTALFIAMRDRTPDAVDMEIDTKASGPARQFANFWQRRHLRLA